MLDRRRACSAASASNARSGKQHPSYTLAQSASFSSANPSSVVSCASWRQREWWLRPRPRLCCNGDNQLRAPMPHMLHSTRVRSARVKRREGIGRTTLLPSRAAVATARASAAVAMEARARVAVAMEARALAALQWRWHARALAALQWRWKRAR